MRCVPRSYAPSLSPINSFTLLVTVLNKCSPHFCHTDTDAHIAVLLLTEYMIE